MFGAQLGIGTDQAALDGIAAHGIRIDSGSIIGYFDHNSARAVEGAERNHALFGLTRRLAHIRGFDAMVGGIANQVSQRIAEHFEHTFVDLRLFSVHLQANTLAGSPSEVVDGARVPLEERSDRQHANSHHLFLQLTGVALHCLYRLAQLGQASRFEVRDHLRRHHVRDHQFADEIDQTVDLASGYADGTRLWTGDRLL